MVETAMVDRGPERDFREPDVIGLRGPERGHGSDGDTLETTTSVDKALAILELIAGTSVPLSLAEIADSWGIPKPTAHRLLQTLLRRGYVRQDSDRAYTSGPRTLEMGRLARATFDYARVARPTLIELRERTGQTIQLGILDDFQVRCVDQLEGSGAFRMASRIGYVLDLHTTAIGKSVLAFAEPALRDEFLASGRQQAKTTNTVTSVPALRRRLDLIVEQGFAIDEKEDQPHVCGVGAPVFSERSFAIGGVSVSGPEFEISRADAEKLASLVMSGARAISLALGAEVEALPKAHQQVATAIRGGGRRG
jgi:IclR family transcriptional regulator, acetate operon repressor